MSDEVDRVLKFFQDKIDIPTEWSDELRGEAHAKGFTIAGAVKAELLADLREAVGSAIANGESIGQFRKRFDTIVAEYGWSYRGKRGWRTRTIYDTNRRSANMAGRWEQIQRTKARRPYLEYQTVGDNNVRDEHRGWDNLVLLADDPWWDSHFPPNGWGCRCTVRTLSQREVDERGLDLEPAPPVNLQERTNTRTGEVLEPTPEGVDTGWGYNVGRAWLGPDIAFGEAIMRLPTPLRDQSLTNAARLTPKLQTAFTPWALQAISSGKAKGEIKTVGYLTPDLINRLEKVKAPSTAVITITDTQLINLQRDIQANSGISPALLSNLPTRLQNPDSILWDKQNPALIFVYGSDELDEKLVVRINVAVKVFNAASRAKQLTNELVTAGLLSAEKLSAAKYESWN